MPRAGTVAAFPEPGDPLHERLAIAGSGTIAAGLAAVAAAHGEVLLWAPGIGRTRLRALNVRAIREGRLAELGLPDDTE